MTQTNAKKIVALLNRAGEAHHHYEQTVLKGVYDRDWAIRYAEYAIAHGLDLLLDRRLTKAQLSLFLSEINQKYNQEQSGLSWAEYTANKFVLHMPKIVDRDRYRQELLNKCMAYSCGDFLITKQFLLPSKVPCSARCSVPIGSKISLSRFLAAAFKAE